MESPWKFATQIVSSTAIRAWGPRWTGMVSIRAAVHAQTRNGIVQGSWSPKRCPLATSTAVGHLPTAYSPTTVAVSSLA